MLEVNIRNCHDAYCTIVTIIIAFILSEHIYRVYHTELSSAFVLGALLAAAYFDSDRGVYNMAHCAGVDLEKLLQAGTYIADALGRPVGSRIARAMAAKSEARSPSAAATSATAASSAASSAGTKAKLTACV